MVDHAQLKAIRTQLLTQLNTLPEDQRTQAKKQIETMNDDELVKFLENNSMLGEGECIFCSIIEGKIPSHELRENEDAKAILEINPITLGHTLIVPKKHTKTVSKEMQELAKKAAEQLKRLKPKKIEIIPSSLFGHEILNVLPIYENETLDSPRKKAKDTELARLLIQLQRTEENVEPKKVEQKTTVLSENTPWLPKRIP